MSASAWNVVRFKISGAGIVLSSSAVAGDLRLEEISRKAIGKWKFQPEETDSFSNELRSGCALILFLVPDHPPDLTPATDVCRDLPISETPSDEWQLLNR
jgi:hypothetical protein